MTFKRRAAIAAMALLVSSCGGGGSSGSNPVTLAPGGNTPTPTPTPTPSPTYLTYTDALSDWTATTPFAFVQYVRKGVPGAQDVPVRMTSGIQGRMVQVDFKGRPNVTASFADFDLGKFASFADKDIAVNNSDVGLFLLTYLPNGGSANLWNNHPYFSASAKERYELKYFLMPEAQYEYVSNAGSSERTTLDYSFIVGDKTKLTDLPKDKEWPGYAYHIFMRQPFHAPADPNFPYYADGNLDYVPATGKVSGWLQYNDQTQTGQAKTSHFTLSGTINEQTHRVSGDITSENGLYVGEFQGDFYGPKGKEIGLLFAMKSKDGTFATAGTMYGAIIVCSNTVNGVVGNTVVCG